MGSWFLSKSPDTAQSQPLSSLMIQSSVQGKPIPMGWGRMRVSPNIIWYGDFISTAVPDASSGGGKGGGSPLGGSGKGQQGSVSYTYSASFQLALCEGPIQNVLTTWIDKAISTATGTAGTNPNVFGVIAKALGLIPPDLGFELFNGNYNQDPWPYLTSKHPDQALNYRGLAYVAQANVSLGSGAQLSNYSFEITFGIAFGAPDIPDANPRDVVVDFLTNVFNGVPGWPANRLASLNQYATYALATGLLVSPVLVDQTEASAFLSDLFAATNSSPRWSSGKLDVIPWGDSTVTGNGVTYVPQVTPLYDLTNDDFLPAASGSSGNQPITSTRKDPSQRLNIIQVEYLDRNNSYNPDIVDDKDQASIQQYGSRQSSVYKYHFFCVTAPARLSAHLSLIREQIPNTYTFNVGAWCILPDVEDILTLTRPELALFRQPVRITEITDNSDGSITFVTEEYLGTAGAPLYGSQANTGWITNTNADPGAINPPLMFEPTDELGGGLYVWAAVSGVNLQLWGGCNVYASYDDATYQYIANIKGPSRMGVLTAPLAAVTANPAGPPTIDTAHTLSVDLTVSAGVLSSGTQADALALNTACYVDGEIVAYQTATLTGPDKYDLTYLVRGAFGSETSIVPHAAGSAFARLDSQILKVPYEQQRIGSVIYLKFQSFNIWGGGPQDISSLAPYPYKLTGAALASPLPPVANVRTVFEAGFTKIWWEEIVDFRQGIRYIIRKGDTFAGGQELGSLAHPPFIAFGAGTYWIMPTCQPLANLIVYGEAAESITVQGNMLTTNIVQTTDYQATGWPGIFTGVGKEGSDPTAVLRLASTADFLSDPNVIVNPDVLNSGVISTTGIYAVDPAQGLNVGYVADCYVNITWQSAGIPVGTDVLTDNDFLNNPDVLNAAGGAFVDVWIEVRTAATSTGDMFGPADMFGPDVPDWFNSGIQWGAWQRYVPGVYRAQYIQYRAVFETIDTNIIAYLLGLVVQVSIPARIDHYIGNSVGTGGLTIVFMPDDAILSKPFNGGTLVGGTSNHPLPSVSMDWPGHPGVNFVIDAISLSQMTFHFEDGTGTHIAVAGVDTVVEGY